MSVRSILSAGLAVVLAAGAAVAAEPVKSGPQAGEQLAGPFHPLNINGEAAGKKHCLYCQNGQAPVAMVFARDVSEPLVKLLKQLDEAAVKNSDYSMGTFAVFCSDDAALEGKLKALAEKENFKKLVLSIDNPAGPKGYNVSKDADVTVVLYKERTSKANHAFGKGQLKEKDVEKVVGDLTKILPTK
jgi:hypothetical protein